ncbi:hypothetical protein ACIP4W_41010 [Streptomyces sp. NPDC088846]|uniref:hypothetical protein n=1 Tax=Streptomyces sp. NPDC088846 TaxID=3365908 RepID=UPI003818B31D
MTMRNEAAWSSAALLSYLTSNLAYGADPEQCARYPHLTPDIAEAGAAVQRRYDGERTRVDPDLHTDPDPMVRLRARADAAGGYLAVPLGEVREACADDDGLALDQVLGAYALGVLPAAGRLTGTADDVRVVLYPCLSPVGEILRTAARQAAGELVGQPTWPTAVEAQMLSHERTP